ncbi:(S)-2-haloacid dehalogenase 1 [Rhodovastum atsumiense]|uniref:(S)-2-haloacid dehalogenase n=1 Tax=Rhodovastum atsumiense TaxID=504468 RepID=A0A5M6J4W5_9PROT|nr:haloacid dehalogenase type II [Rhodovastum atsumiense]KAA5614628.1 haloacid dehalogenase type II [Rhodovastum atsumiense]CAH2599862.1 (S)-2-haloacid dehalogenase 1 [Rhodovastum atsumiense]
MGLRAVVFDAYGTLLDVHSAMARHAPRLGAQWQALSAEWRSKQLEYTWVRSLAGPTHHQDFAQATDRALDFVAARHGIDDPALLADLRAAYRSLSAYPEVPGVLAALRAKGLGRAILSNGTPAMLAEAVRAAGLDGALDAVLSVESVGVFKPDPRVYRLAAERLGHPTGAMGFASSNAWDAFGARAAGFHVFWINRSGQPDEYGLRGTVCELPDLAALPEKLLT